MDESESDEEKSPEGAPALLEACCDSRASVRAAVAGGAARVEVCARGSLGVGGLTPSPTLVKLCLDACAGSGCRLVALVRPRPGDFVYCADEVAEMVAEIASLRRVGCAAFAVGALTADGCVNFDALATLVAAARAPARAQALGDGEAEDEGVAVVFHRAVDEVLRRAPDLGVVARLVDALAAAGVDRVLSSGGAATARGGRSTLWALDKACRRRGVALCVAGGVTAASAALLVRDTGARELHAATALSEDVPRGNPCDLFFATERVVSEARCRSFVAELRAAARRRPQPPALVVADDDAAATASPFSAMCSVFGLPKTAWPLFPL